MKKINRYIFSLLIACMAITSCEDPYAKQIIAEPGSYEQLALQDTTGFVAVIKAGLSPLIIQANKLADSVSLITCTSVLTLADTAATTKYKLEFANTADFAKLKTIPISFNGKSGSDVKASYKDFNDSIKGYNKNAIQRTVYIRLLAYIVKGGTKSLYKTGTMTVLVTPYSYPPLAMNDNATTPMNGSISIAVLTNDSDPETDILTVASTTTPSHGTTTINIDGKVTYTPTTGYSGADSFNYTISDGNGNTSTATVDITILAVNPYTIVTPRPYYIIGLANGAWNNSADGLGVSIYPLSVVTGNKYNIAGDGEYTFTGYFSASRGFKLIRDLGNWDEQWGQKDGALVHNDGGSSDIKVAADGYYTISLNSITNTLTIIPALVIPTNHTEKGIGLIGDITGWSSDIVMTAAETTNNHIWYTTYTFTSDATSDGGVKFREIGNWDVNWGGDAFPKGLTAGDNIKYKAGTYTIIFNDVNGNYYFIKK